MTSTMTPKTVLRLLSPGKCQRVEIRVRVHKIHTVHMEANKAQVRRMLHDQLGPKSLINVTVLDAETGGRHLDVVKGKVAEPYRLVIGQ